MKIQKLTLQSTSLLKQRLFYSEILGFQEVRCTSEELHYQVGDTHLIFIENEAATPYHFAFNIPSNRIEEALVWLKERTEVLKNENDEVQHFESWCAKAIYGYDADHNIIEFIARDNLNVHSSHPFSATSILSVSEIGIVSEDNRKVHDFLTENFSLPVFTEKKDVFSAIGDDEGLFICMDRTKRKWFPTSEEAFCSAFDVEFMEKGKAFHLRYANQQLQIV